MRLAALSSALAAAAGTIAGCGGAGHASSSTSATTTSAAHTRPRAQAPARLRQTGAVTVPEGRSGVAVAVYNGRLFVIGGLSPAGISTDTVFEAGTRHSATLPGPVHDAAAAVLGGRLMLFGGGESEGSNRIIAVMPGQARVVGTLPQALSDLEAVTVGRLAYVIGGWNGSATNRDLYAVGTDGHVSLAGRIPTGVRYAAAGVLGGRLIVAGGELASGAPTKAAYAFDPSTSAITRLPDLPVATDHTAGVAIAGSFYVIGGLRDGSFTNAIVSWRPGQRRWREAGHLPQPVADAGAAVLDGRVALAAGRNSSGKLATVALLSAVSR